MTLSVGDIFAQVLVTLATLGISWVAILAYFGRSAVTHFFARDLERYKNQLSGELEQQKQQATIELEARKRELDAILSERQTRFSLMHQKRAEVVAELYGRIPRAEHAIRVMTAVARLESTDKEVEKKRRESERKEATTAFNDLVKYFDKHRIYLGEETAERCEQLISHLRKAVFNYDYAKGSTPKVRKIHASG
jgi:hypothetical protein